MFGSNSLLRSLPCQFLTTILIIAGLTVSAAPPIWWTTPDAANFRVIDPAVTDSNAFGPANIGQGKYIAKRALEALSTAVGGNTVIQTQVVAAIEQELYKTEENSPTGVFYPVAPDEPTPEWLDAQKVPLQIGAMKAMAAPFYRHLSAMNGNWVKNQLITNGLTLGSGFFQDTDGTYYPWNPADNSSTLKNRAPATIGQLKVVFSLRFEALDIDGDGVVDSADQNGDGIPDSAQDLDGDGLIGSEEKELGTDPKKWDSDGDLLGDGEDAVPTEAEINWKKTPENRYVWVEQMTTPVDQSAHPIVPVATNSTGLILFEKFTEGSISYPNQVRVDTRKNVLWDSTVKNWVTLSNSSSQTIEIDERLAISGSDSIGSFKDINDAGTISGIGDVTVPMPVADEDHKTHGILSGMVWKKSTNSSTTNPLIYDAPTHYIYHSSHSIDTRCTGQIGDFYLTEVSCRIGIDDSINVTPYIDIDPGPILRESVWMIHDGVTNPAILDIRVQDLSEISLPGGILDKNRALCVIGSGLYLKDQNSVQLVTTGTIHAGATDIVLAPEKKTDNSERLWIAAGSTVLLEKRTGGNGAARWHNLAEKQNSDDKTKSMAEGAIRLNARGEAITPGKPDPTAPVYPKLWRNGKYTDLNDAKLTAKPTDVEITEAIDLASNGIILVQAKKGTETKTGLLLPVEVRDGDRCLTSLSRDDDPWTNANIQKQISDTSIAWITGNTAAVDKPEMPKLNARILGGPASVKVRWRFECEYRRGNGYRKAYVSDFTRPEDKVGIPKRDGSESTGELPASQEWKIYEHPKWIQELNENGFFGGLGKVFLRLNDLPEIEACRFRIGGQNPDEDVARAYINSKAGATYWYAYAVAKHETFGRVPGRFYNQFYTEHQPDGGRIGDTANDMGWAAWAKAWPLYNLDRSYSPTSGYRQNGPGGYGMFQLTLGPKTPGGDQSSEGFITRAQIWDWQANCDRAITELQDKMNNAINLENGLEGGNPTWPQVDTATYGRLVGREASVLTYYNGMYGGELERVKVTNGRSLSCWKPVQSGSGANTTRAWRFLQNINDYVQQVNSHIE